MWGDNIGRCREIRAERGMQIACSWREMWGDVGRCGEMWGDKGRSRHADRVHRLLATHGELLVLAGHHAARVVLELLRRVGARRGDHQDRLRL